MTWPEADQMTYEVHHRIKLEGFPDYDVVAFAADPDGGPGRYSCVWSFVDELPVEDALAFAQAAAPSRLAVLRRERLGGAQ